MVFRKKVIRNIPYFKDISDDLTLELICLLREQSFDFGTLVVKHGLISDRIFIIW